MNVRRIPALVLAVLAIIGLSESPALAGVIAPPQPGGLTGSVHLSCEGPAGLPTVTVVVHNADADHFGVSIWANGPNPIGNLAVPGHTTQQATFSDAAWEDTTVVIDVLRIGSVVVASGSHRFDCQRNVVVTERGVDLLMGKQ